MRYAAYMTLFVLALLGWSPAPAQVDDGTTLTRDDYGPDGVPMNQDYFRANLFKTTRELLQVVEAWHVNPKVFEDFRHGKYYDVSEDMKYTLRKFPNHPRALMLLASVSRLVDNPEMAFPYFEHALDLYPQYAITHAQYGHHLLNSGTLDAAIKELEKATELDPVLVQAYEWLADAYARRGDSDAARQATEQARRLRGGSISSEAIR